jgi:CRISPR-associated protein Cmr2
VIPKDVYPTVSNDPQEGMKVQNLYRRYRARRGEQLSGVDLLKRLGQRGSSIEQKFKSTSHMAALPYLQMTRRKKAGATEQQLFDAIQDFLREEGIDSEDKDGSLLYESRLREWLADGSKLAMVRKQLTEILQNWSGSKADPGVYYALLRADGDNMGKAIDNQTSRDGHRKLSQALSQFADEASKIVEDHQGVPIFSGGDDVLAYLPIHTVLQCAHKLADRFENVLQSFSFTEDGQSKSPTLSTGIAVVHHLDPLSDSLELARDAEKEAKKVPGKDALAITVSKRSGVDRTIVGPRKVLADRLDNMIEFVYTKQIGVGAAYELQELHRIFTGTALATEAAAAEALRILKRKRESQSDKELGKPIQNQFREWINVAKISISDLAQELIVAGVFADAQEMAVGPATPEKEEIQ